MIGTQILNNSTLRDLPGINCAIYFPIRQNRSVRGGQRCQNPTGSPYMLQFTAKYCTVSTKVSGEKIENFENSAFEILYAEK